MSKLRLYEPSIFPYKEKNVLNFSILMRSGMSTQCANGSKKTHEKKSSGPKPLHSKFRDEMDSFNMRWKSSHEIALDAGRLFARDHS